MSAVDATRSHRFVPSTPFVPAKGLRSAHAQTIFANLVRRPKLPALHRERFELPDGDFVDVDRLDARPEAPHLLVLHGLEGSTKSGYVAEILRLASVRGWGAAALNFRSCSGEPNRLARSYHSGDTGDSLHVLTALRARTRGPWGAVGFSLGGNVLLRLLAEQRDRVPLEAAVAISVPYDLRACARTLDTGGGLTAVYRVRFLRTLKRKAMQKSLRHRDTIDRERVRRVRGIEAFDDVVTAPIHGYRNGADYYDRCSSGPVLERIERPTLLISSSDDPLVPLPLPQVRSGFVSTLYTDAGGHVGFVSGTPLRPRFWAEEQALRFLEERLATSQRDLPR